MKKAGTLRAVAPVSAAAFAAAVACGGRRAAVTRTCSTNTCDWTNVRDLGALHQTSALGASGPVIYAGWCGNGCHSGGAKPFISGIDTNYGGAWHRVNSKTLPRRIPTSFAVDPSDPAHVFVTYGAFNRRWIGGAGVGHVFESTDGATTWVDRSGNLPDAPANKIIVWGSRLAVGTDVRRRTTAGSGRWRRGPGRRPRPRWCR